MAEAIAKKWADQNEKSCLVASAGMEAVNGWYAAEHARAICSPYLDNHISKEVTEGLLSQFDVVFTMMPGHMHGILVRYPRQADKVFPLALDGSPIDDPYGGNLDEYERVFSILQTHVHKRMNELFFGRI